MFKAVPCVGMGWCARWNVDSSFKGCFKVMSFLIEFEWEGSWHKVALCTCAVFSKNYRKTQDRTNTKAEKSKFNQLHDFCWMSNKYIASPRESVSVIPNHTLHFSLFQKPLNQHWRSDNLWLYYVPKMHVIHKNKYLFVYFRHPSLSWPWLGLNHNLFLSPSLGPIQFLHAWPKARLNLHLHARISFHSSFCRLISDRGSAIASNQNCA